MANVDRSRRNTNLLIWHRNLWAIDHGACLRFHHAWGDPATVRRVRRTTTATTCWRASATRGTCTTELARGHGRAAGRVLADVRTPGWRPTPTRPDPEAPPDAAAAREPTWSTCWPGWPRPSGGCREPRTRFQYAVLRAVPRVERGEFINIGVILYCQADGLPARGRRGRRRPAARAGRRCRPRRGPDLRRGGGQRVPARADGSARENTGLATRFGMLTAPRSTVVQPSPVHAGVTDNPERTLANATDQTRRPVALSLSSIRGSSSVDLCQNSAMLRVDSHYLWDSWMADDGELYHLFFLMAPRSLGTPAKRHVNATVGHASSRDLVDWDYPASASARRPTPARSTTWRSGPARWSATASAGGCSTRRCPTAVITSTTSGSGRRSPMTCSTGSGWATSRPCWSTRRWYKTLATTPRRPRVPTCEDSSETWRDPVVFADPDGDGWHMLITARDVRAGRTTTA